MLASILLGEDNNVKDTSLLLQLTILIIPAHTNADYNSLSFCSEPKGKVIKVQYQLAICVLQLFFVHAFTVGKKAIFQNLVKSDQIIAMFNHYNTLQHAHRRYFQLS